MTDRRRRQKEQRAAKREAEKKQEARKELGRRLGTALVFGVVVVGIVVAGAFFGNDEASHMREKPGLVRIDFDTRGHVIVHADQPYLIRERS